jgi:hypothetical protein
VYIKFVYMSIELRYYVYTYIYVVSIRISNIHKYCYIYDAVYIIYGGMYISVYVLVLMGVIFELKIQLISLSVV